MFLRKPIQIINSQSVAICVACNVIVAFKRSVPHVCSVLCVILALKD